MGSGTASRPRLYVIQKHDATRLHYDFRLEWGGTLLSWAVPKGPSPNPKEKRLAVHVEDHPVEYADFEGKIPKGNYGAGAVIVWDRGLWVPIDDPDEGLPAGKLHFELRGHKLRGEWILVRTKQAGPKDWLLMKKADAYSTDAEEPFTEESVFSGLTVEELRDGQKRAQTIHRRLTKLKVPRRALDPMKLKLMLADTAEKPFSGKDWLFELKYDGYRVVAAKNDAGKPVLRSRNAHDYTKLFPEIARVVGSLPYQRVVIDGELVVLNDEGRPSFQALQKRSQLRRSLDIDRATVQMPVTMFAFDLLEFEGVDLRGLPLTRRKEILREVLPKAGAIRFADHIPVQGAEMYEKVKEMGLEGIMAKRAEGPYRGARSRDWLKVPVDRTGDFVVIGYTAPQGSRTGFGALHLGVHENGELVYAGRVGTGFSDSLLVSLGELLSPLRRKTPVVSVPAALTGPGKHFWVKSDLVVEVRYKTVTEEGLLRHPAFLRLREDKDPEECIREPVYGAGAEVSGASASVAAAPTGDPVVEEAPRRVKLVNLKKVFWPEEGYTKGDLIEYYRWVSPWMLPYLADRPMVLTRYPDGIEGKSFYQKNVPDFVPSWIRTESVWSDHTQREIKYFVCDDVETLTYIVNSGAIPLHVWSSRTAAIANPDWCILDLDPKGAPFADVLTLAKAIHALCERIGLPNYAKTSGSTGLHVLIPLGGQCTYEQSRTLGNLIARVIHTEYPDISTIARTMAQRKGRVYLDYLQNRHGQLLVSPYCVRPFPGAPVSAPLEWREVNSKLDPRKYTIKNMRARLARKKKDPMLPVLSIKPDLVGALAALAEETQSDGENGYPRRIGNPSGP